jgi:hypothetical protein
MKEIVAVIIIGLCFGLFLSVRKQKARAEMWKAEAGRAWYTNALVWYGQDGRGRRIMNDATISDSNGETIAKIELTR